jgi:hypothetical protein
LQLGETESHKINPTVHLLLGIIQNSDTPSSCLVIWRYLETCFTGSFLTPSQSCHESFWMKVWN